MAAADILQRIYNYFNVPGAEAISLTVTDGETYQSKKFKTILGALATGNSNVDADLNVTHSGSVATINWAGQTDKALTLLLFGRK